TTVDTCQAGACTGGSPVVCAAGDACHEAGACNPETGQCAMVPKPNGTACSDGNACTRNDVCQAGTCVPGAPVECGAGDAGHEAGVCNPENGQCVTATKPDGTRCNDGNACTQSDTCQAGACVGANPITCQPSDACHAAGTCDPSTGMCSNPAKPEGA